jgi:hypothetical protein
MVFLTRNCDLGDAWEWINDPRNPAQFGFVAYKVGINVIVYAMSTKHLPLVPRQFGTHRLPGKRSRVLNNSHRTMLTAENSANRL